MVDTATRLKRAAIVAIFTFGVTALVAVLSGPGPAQLVAAIAVFGWFILTPFVALFDLPVIDDEAATDEDDATADPLETLRERYAAGEISEAEFDRKVERLLETDRDALAGTTGRERRRASDRHDPDREGVELEPERE